MKKEGLSAKSPHLERSSCNTLLVSNQVKDRATVLETKDRNMITQKGNRVNM
jgi:hypothetical protein